MPADYRTSHLAKGETYDAGIAERPFDAYMARVETAYLRRVAPALARGARYLDFACGTGRITETVAPFAAESVGVDISDTMLAAARRKCPGTRFVAGDLTTRDLDIGSFDLATSFRFFGNAQDDLREAAMAAIARHVRPGDHLIVNNHRNPRAIGAALQTLTGNPHELDLSHGKFVRLLHRHGFRVVSVRSVGVWVIRSRMRTAQTLDSPLARFADRALGSRVFAPVAPDAIVIARRA